MTELNIVLTSFKLIYMYIVYVLKYRFFTTRGNTKQYFENDQCPEIYKDLPSEGKIGGRILSKTPSQNEGPREVRKVCPSATCPPPSPKPQNPKKRAI